MNSYFQFTWNFTALKLLAEVFYFMYSVICWFIYCEMTVRVVANRVFTFLKDVRGSVGNVCFVFLTYWNLWESLRGYMMVTTSFAINLVKVVGPKNIPLALKAPEKFMTDCVCTKFSMPLTFHYFSVSHSFFFFWWLRERSDSRA